MNQDVHIEETKPESSRNDRLPSSEVPEIAVDTTLNIEETVIKTANLTKAVGVSAPSVTLDPNCLGANLSAIDRNDRLRKTIRSRKSYMSLKSAMTLPSVSLSFTETEEATFLESQEKSSDESVFSPDAPRPRTITSNFNRSIFSTNSLRTKIKPSKSFTSLLESSDDDILTGNYDDTDTAESSDDDCHVGRETRTFPLAEKIVPRPVHSSLKKIQDRSDVFQSTPNKASPTQHLVGSLSTPPIQHRDVVSSGGPERVRSSTAKTPHNNTVADESLSSPVPVVVRARMSPRSSPNNNTVADESFPDHVNPQSNNNTVADDSSSHTDSESSPKVPKRPELIRCTEKTNLGAAPRRTA
jgi:hypothetical protein